MAVPVFVYPAEPAELAETPVAALEAVGSVLRREVPPSWADPGTPGAFVATPVLQQIDECDYLAADLTRLTFNISYLVGYAIGRGKPLLITRSGAIEGDGQLARDVGLFGALSHRQYHTGRQLASLLVNSAD